MTTAAMGRGLLLTSVPAMPLSLAGIAAGLLLLTWAADQFVFGAARVARRLNLSSVVIGAVVIGFGTSAPEMVVSGIAAGRGSLDFAVGNVIGSNVANLSLVLGVSAMVVPIAVRSPVMRREAPLSLAAVLLFGLLVQGGLTTTEAIILGVALTAALAVILVGSIGHQDDVVAAEVEEFLQGPAHPWWQDAARTVAGLVGTVAAAQLLVVSATDVAGRMGLAEGFVGLTIVAIGTSLPELATSLVAARKNETDLIVGNLLGSNLFNSLAVGGVAAGIGAGPLTDPTLSGTATLLMIGVATVATIFMASGRRVTRGEGTALVIVYVIAVPLLA